MSEQNDNANDYALAKCLDERVVVMFELVANSGNDTPDLTALNRSYVLLVNELRKLYERNPKLREIKENICWRTFDTLDAIDPYTLYEYSDDYMNHAIAHISKVNSLSIIAGKETANIPPELKDMLNEAGKAMATFAAELNRVRPKVKDWCIPTYTLTYDEIRGTIKINGVYQLNKRSTNDSSSIDELLKQALANPNELFAPQLRKTAQNLSTIISKAGFDPTLKALFFPVVRKNKGVLCRPVVTRAEADAEGMDTGELDLKLKEAGATTQPVRPF